ncbi:hypothetical protein NQ317_009957 [Molorchus minor]|uniref:Ig-like domain-containing protein n=1 Tax=Molorchus minor TaxID=1323400 RepID=A0ABQ9K738_9CUCU|nr:hypothetical protein NQ317_009957 [Molorchus minor]
MYLVLFIVDVIGCLLTVVMPNKSYQQLQFSNEEEERLIDLLKEKPPLYGVKNKITKEPAVLFSRTTIMKILIYCLILKLYVYSTVLATESEYIENITVISNTTLVLQCPASKNKNNVKWKALEDLNNTKGHIIQSNSPILELSPVTTQDKGYYACLANETEVIKKYNVTVLEPPHFIKERQMQKLIVKPAGNMVKLVCRAGGVPPPNITWYRDDKSPPKRELGDIKTNHWSLTLEDLVLNDRGNYTCVVCNIVGCINFTYVVDVVERFPSKPYIKEGYPKNLTVLENRTAIFACPQVIVDLEPYIQWFRVDRYTDIDDHNNFNGTPLQKDETSPVDPEIYQIVNVTHEDEGWYACFASNSLGTTVSKAYLEIVDEEPEINMFNKDEPTNFFTIGIVAVIGALLVLSVISFMCIHFRQKIKREKREKMIAVETARAAIKTTQWTKKVIIEKMTNAPENVSEPLK